MTNASHLCIKWYMDWWLSPGRFGIDNDDWRTRRTHWHKFREKMARTDDCKFLFTNHTISEWNKVPAEMAEAGSLNIFKGRLAAHLDWSCRTTGGMSTTPYQLSSRTCFYVITTAIMMPSHTQLSRCCNERKETCFHNTLKTKMAANMPYPLRWL